MYHTTLYLQLSSIFWIKNIFKNLKLKMAHEIEK